MKTMEFKNSIVQQNNIHSNYELLNQLEARKLKQIVPSKKDFEHNFQTEVVKKQQGYVITELRAQLDAKLLNIIHLQLCTFHYFEVPLAGHKKPLIINFTFTNQAKMKFYISRHTLTPNRFNFEEAFQRKQVLRYTEPGEDNIFTTPFLYMAIFSQQQSIIHAKIQYGMKIQKLQKQDQEEKERPMTAFMSGRISSALSRKQSKDLILMNMNLRQYEPENQKKQLQIKRVQSAKRFQETLVNKQIIDQDKQDLIKERYEHSQKKKIIKDILNVRDQIDQSIKEQQKNWLTNLYSILICRLIRVKYIKMANHMMNEATIIRKKHRTRLNLKQYLTKHGETIQQRTKFQTLQSLCVFAQVYQKTVKTRAEFICFSFMKSYGQIGEIIQKTYRFRRLIRTVIDSYRNYKKRVGAYVQRIIMLWNKYWGVMYNQIQKEDIEKVKEIKKQMNKTIINFQVDEEVKKSPYLDGKLQIVIVQNYYKQLKAEFITKFRSVYKKGKSGARGAYIAAQGFEVKDLNLFKCVDKTILKELIYKYMLEKRMIQSVLLKK
ncbi:unnamed protein product [Paramecium primaurelia]|uniref:Uncharacterized protein n=1 Tax=Paramecium primaurelia TaxID=5886 RepID=A0A8S1LCB6_PARPR|nr:unnamed protein product [Paramecium primaurelia]